MVKRDRSVEQRLPMPRLKLSSAQMSALQAAVDPASPPDTPTELLLPRQNHQSPFCLCASSLAHDANIRPYGSGHRFSYRPLDQLGATSPSSASSRAVKDPSEGVSWESVSITSLPGSLPRLQHASNVHAAAAAQSEGSDADSESSPASDSDLDLDAADGASKSGYASAAQSDADTDTDTEWKRNRRAGAKHAYAVGAAETFQFTIEDVDPLDSEGEDVEILLPTEVESSCGRSRSRDGDLDKTMMKNLRNLSCSNEASDNDAECDESEEAFLKRQQELKRIRRVSLSSSFGKRSHSELSDSDDNDGVLDVNEVGSSARRFRKRLHRGSILFQDLPEPRIDELEEPNSEDEYAKELTALAAKLPFWSVEMMEMDAT